MISIYERKFINSMILAGHVGGLWLDADDQDEQREQLYTQMMGWA